MRGLTGYTSAVIQFVWSNPLYARRVAEAYNLAGKEPAETIPGLSWQTYLEITELTKLVSAVLGNTLTLAGGIKGQQFSRYDFQVFQEDGIELRTLGGSGAEGDGEEPGEIPGMPWSRTQPGTFDVVEFWVLLGVAFMMLGHDIVKIYRRFTGDEFSTEVAHGELAEASELLVAKDIVGSIGSLTGFLWNGKFASTKYSAVELYALMAGLRVTSGFASVALHTTAMFKDLHPPD